MLSTNTVIQNNLAAGTIKYPAQPWIVCFSAALFFFFEFIQMNMFNVINADLMSAFSINATEIGKLSAYYFYANLLFLPVAGALLDRFSTRTIILVSLLTCVAGIALFAISHSLVWSKVFRFMSGIGSAFCFLSSMRLASRWFPAKRMAMITGLIVTMAMIGGGVSQTPLSLLIEAIGWRSALLTDAALGALIALLIFFVVRDYPEGAQAHHQAVRDDLQNLGLWRSWQKAYLNYRNWLGGIYTSLLNLPVALLGAIWGSLYLQQIEHFSPTQASSVTMMIFFGTIFGGPLLGWLSDRLQNRRYPMLIGALLSLVIVLMIIYRPGLSFTTYLVLFFLLGFITSTQVISYPLIAESNPRMLTATSVSVVSFCAIGGYAVFQPLFGWLMDLHWQGLIINNVHVYSVGDFHRALLIMPAGFAVSILATLLMRETHCKPLD